MIFEKVREIIASHLNLDKESITPDTNLSKDTGADSLDIYQIITELEEIYEIEFDNSTAERIKTVGDAVKYIENAMN